MSDLFSMGKKDFLQIGLYVLGLAIAIAVLNTKMENIQREVMNMSVEMDVANERLWDIQQRLSLVEGQQAEDVTSDVEQLLTTIRKDTSYAGYY